MFCFCTIRYAAVRIHTEESTDDTCSFFHFIRGGVYCGPLRLLALEVFDSLNRQGVYTNLQTGQERQDVDFATHTSCTVEMVKLDKEYDVAVVDEIQMIANDQRGYAWLGMFMFLLLSCVVHNHFSYPLHMS